ncbi:hypothetical protein J7S19_01570 [Corynebacterium pyruviciproducens]|uniref:hypothetical protein n=1 Tax=Corynebacterium TaxID=1716 RepID=UPI00223A9E16|nr:MULTISPECIES: hypothetical protein [Corynebacterium]MCT1442234.1 hypothetical protein [Corynebacterium glucuronolyticum]MDH4657317.1 hypothetical protein [Corynebacterium pyruviciproducens]
MNEEELGRRLVELYKKARREGRSPVEVWYYAGYLEAEDLKGMELLYKLSLVPMKDLLDEALKRGLFLEPGQKRTPPPELRE